ncbi:MAG: DUF86 domain-containing protein [Blastocatellia bacterium]
MQHDRACLLDIIEAAKLAVSYVEGGTKEAFLQSTQLQDSVIRRIEILGEAARRISLETRAKHPDFPWNEMIGMRNLMIHKYDDVDLEVVWQTIRMDLPALIRQIEPLTYSNQDEE